MFSFLIEHGAFTSKFENDSPESGSIGLTLREVDGATGRPEDYDSEARREFGFYKAENAYQIYDGDGAKRLDVPFTDAGLSVTITLVTADTYELEVVTMSPKKIHRLIGRKLAGKPGALIRSPPAVFNRNG